MKTAVQSQKSRHVRQVLLNRSCLRAVREDASRTEVEELPENDPVGAGWCWVHKPPGRLRCPFIAKVFWEWLFHGVATGWKQSARLSGEPDLVQLRAGFLKDAERWVHGVPVANHPSK